MMISLSQLRVRCASINTLNLFVRMQCATIAALLAGVSVCGHAEENQQQSAAEVAATPTDTDSKTDDKTSEIAGLKWITDYYTAYRKAAKEQRMLLVFFTPSSNSQVRLTADEAIAAQPNLQAKLDDVVLCRVSVDAEICSDGNSTKLLTCTAFRELRGGAGFALIDLQNQDASYYGRAVTVLPLASGKYYRWSAQGLAVALDLPPGTLTQRSLIWAVRMHPERPQSTVGQFNPHLAVGAAQHASYQASITKQGHHNFENRFHQLSAAAGSGVTEVCAESWPQQNLIDSCIDCVASWRHSSGHWRAVRRRHRAFGYDIRRGRNGIWYATGLFAD